MSTTPDIVNRAVAGETEHNFELLIGGTRQGYLEYSLPDSGTMVIHYVEVDPHLRGKGMGERLVGAAVAWAREQKRRIVPMCSYARAVIARTPAFQDLVKK